MSAVKKTKPVKTKFLVNREPKVKVGIAWYKRDQWQLLLDVSVDRDELEATYAEWKKDAEKAVEQLRQGGLDVVKVNVRIEELLDWCQSQNLPVNATARSKFAAHKLQQSDKGAA